MACLFLSPAFPILNIFRISPYWQQRSQLCCLTKSSMGNVMVDDCVTWRMRHWVKHRDLANLHISSLEHSSDTPPHNSLMTAGYKTVKTALYSLHKERSWAHWVSSLFRKWKNKFLISDVNRPSLFAFLLFYDVFLSTAKYATAHWFCVAWLNNWFPFIHWFLMNDTNSLSFCFYITVHVSFRQYIVLISPYDVYRTDQWKLNCKIGYSC